MNEENYCHGCEKALGIDRSTLYCTKCKSKHVVCFECLFDPDVIGFVPPPGATPMGGYWAKCPIPILVGRRGRK